MNTLVINNKNTILFNQEINTDVTVTAEGVIIQDCKINGSVFLENATNCLVVQTEVSGDITARGSYNSVLLLNKANNINAANNTNLYVVENTLQGELTLNGNNYLLADENTAATILSEDNDNFNGDNITNVDSRLPHGADLDLLPHANKELFVGLERQKAA